MKRDTKVLLEDILQSIVLIDSYVKNLTKEKFTFTAVFID